MNKITKDGCKLSGRSDQIRNRAVMSHLYGIISDPHRMRGQGMCELSVDPTKPFVLKINVGMLVFDGIMVENEEPVEIDLSNQIHTSYFVYAMYNFESDVNTFTVLAEGMVIEPDLIDDPDDIGWVLVGTLGLDSSGIQIVDSTGDSYDINVLNVIEPPTKLLRQTFDELQDLKKSIEENQKPLILWSGSSGKGQACNGMKEDILKWAVVSILFDHDLECTAPVQEDGTIFGTGFSLTDTAHVSNVVRLNRVNETAVNVNNINSLAHNQNGSHAAISTRKIIQIKGLVRR